MDLGCPRQQNKMEENPRSLNLDKYRISFKSYTSEYQNQPSGSTSIGAIASSTVGLSENEPQPGNDSLRKLLKEKAPNLLLEFESSGSLSITSRKLLVKVSVSHLVEQKGFYPSKDDKILLARSIVTVFPSLKINYQEKNEGFEHFFDPVSHCGTRLSREKDEMTFLVPSPEPPRSPLPPAPRLSPPSGRRGGEGPGAGHLLGLYLMSAAQDVKRLLIPSSIHLW
uniref:Uncharacterized protein n=1 Tax=Knipowitschia caucasica TaxID=637954 RepID=A0AAV2KSY4_KNICA